MQRRFTKRVKNARRIPTGQDNDGLARICLQSSYRPVDGARHCILRTLANRRGGILPEHTEVGAAPAGRRAHRGNIARRRRQRICHRRNPGNDLPPQVFTLCVDGIDRRGRAGIHDQASALKLSYRETYHDQLVSQLSDQLGAPDLTLAPADADSQPTAVLRWETPHGAVLAPNTPQSGKESAMLWIASAAHLAELPTPPGH